MNYGSGWKIKAQPVSKEFSKVKKKSVKSKINSKRFKQPGDLQLEIRLDTCNTQNISAI